MKTNHHYHIQNWNIRVGLHLTTIKLIFIFCFLLSALSFEGCKKFIQVPSPKNSLVTADVFNNAGSATSAQLAIYTNMFTNSESWSMAQSMGLYADELENYYPYPTAQQIYSNSLTATNASWSAYYGSSNNYYSYVYAANALIAGLQTTSGCSAAVKRQLTGEAYFTRAFFHFYLTNIFGAVPLVLTTNYATNSKIARAPRLQVLQQVVADLQTAKSLLNTNYVDGSDTVLTNERVRPTKAAALALLARAYLYLGDYSGNSSYYQRADSAASAVIANNAYRLSPLNGVFLANSTEAIWQLQTPSNQSYDTPDGFNFILLGAPSTSGLNNSCTVSIQLISAFEPNDQRKTSWIDSVTEGTNTYYFPYKYKNYTYVGTEYDMVLRLGEQYLIRAEARVREGNNTGGALSDLNMIRNRAGLPNYNGTQDEVSLLTAIQHERQVEMFTEWGSRWFDLERAIASKEVVNANTVLGSPGNVCQYKGGTWNITTYYQLLWPIPRTDISADPNLTQNPGY